MEALGSSGQILPPTFQPLIDALQVKRIMTPKKDFVYYEDYPRENLENCEYDVLPCKDLKHYYDTKAKEMRLILAENVISADTRLFDLIDLFNEKHTVYFVKEGKNIVGLVHYSDLKKHRVRVLFYLMILNLESTFRAVLESYYRDNLDNAVKTLLEPENLTRIEKRLGEDRKKNENLGYVDYLYLEDIRDIF